MMRITEHHDVVAARAQREMWDIGQDVPEESPNTAGMF
jgi:hypothetical protein